MGKLVCLVGVALSSVGLTACGGGGGKLVQPKDISGATANGGNVSTCSAEPKFARPLVVDLDPDARVNLEAAMKKGVVVVFYDCKSLRVLPACKVSKGDYEYAGVSRKERVVQMKNQDELSVNLPLSAGKIGGDVSSGNSIDLALVLVGLKSTTVEKIERSEMTGNCEEATHFLRAASVGAFAMHQGSAGKVSAVADLFKLGVSGSSSSSRNASNTDGSLESCRTSDPDAPTPPSECRSPISVELQPLAGAAELVAKKTEADKPKPAPDGGKTEEKTAKEDAKKVAPKLNPCPAGFSFANGICTRAADTTHICKVENVPDCKEQCEKGSAESCYNYAAGPGGSPAQAEVAYKKSCEGGVGNGCGWYSNFHYDTLNPKAPANKDWIDWARRGCNLGGAESCSLLGDYLWPNTETDRGPLADRAGAIKAYDRSCALGYATGCFSSAEFYLDGAGVAKDEKKGLDLLERGCMGGYTSACVPLAAAIAKSESLHDEARAVRAAKFGCQDAPSECKELASVMFSMKKDAEAIAMLQTSCDREPIFCDWLAAAYVRGHGVPKDPGKAQGLYKRSCAAGLVFDKEHGLTDERDACVKAGVAATTKKKPVGKPRRK